MKVYNLSSQQVNGHFDTEDGDHDILPFREKKKGTPIIGVECLMDITVRKDE
jgi:hypothetical protein